MSRPTILFSPLLESLYKVTNFVWKVQEERECEREGERVLGVSLSLILSLKVGEEAEAESFAYL